LATEVNQTRRADPGGEWGPPPIKIILPNIPQTFHCSIIGTCFSTSDLRKLLLKLNVSGAGSDTEHALHTKAVQLAGMPKEGRLLHKALDRRHRALLNQFKSATGTAALSTLWREAVGKGQIPGAYWAILTHEDTDDTLVQEVFGEVHMLSHLNGVVSRAELRRLTLLEHENAALTIKLERQQRHLNEAFRSRDETIRNLQALLAKQIAERNGTEHSSAASEQHALKATIAGLQKRLSKELSHREHLEQEFKCQSRELANLKRATTELMGENTALHRELEAIETHIDLLVATEVEAASERPKLPKARLLYVGGRTHAISKFRFVIEGLGADFLHHDGGIEHSCSLLPNLINRSDVTLFPVDCVSHDAAATVKRLCGQSNKRYVPLRSASLACLLSALSMLQMEIGGSTCRPLNVENELPRLQV
jgi:hypothetical protein